MRIVHKAGALIRDALVSRSVAESLDPRPAGLPSQDRVFIEADGLWIPIQAATHRKQALSRPCYLQVKKKKSREMKCGVVYAGKSLAGGEVVRGHARFVMIDGTASQFWEAMGSVVEREYESDDIECVWVNTDAGGWCMNCRIGELLSGSASIVQSLDPFHVVKAVERALPRGSVRERVCGLVYARKFARAVKYAKRYLATLSGKRRDKVRAMVSYLEANLATIRFPKESMGTMEGANACVWAARMKNRGMSWSVRGGEAMGLVRARIAANLPLIAPPAEPFFAKREQKAAESSIAKTGLSIGSVKAVGKGWEPPSGTLSAYIGKSDCGGFHYRAGGWLNASLATSRL